MSNTESSEGATLSSDSSLETMLSAAVVAREVTTSDSSDISDSIQEALAAAGLRHSRIKNTNSKIKHIQMPCLVKTDALFDEERYSI